MIIISKKSLLYRFLDTNFITRDDPIPEDLCLFMRRIVVGIAITAFVLAIFALAVFMPMAFAVIAWFIDVELWGPGWSPLVLVGTFLWLGVLAIGVVTLLCRFSRSLPGIRRFMIKSAPGCFSTSKNHGTKSLRFL